MGEDETDNITLDSNSFDSVINSPVQTPIINENTVVEILHSDSAQLNHTAVTPRKHRFRGLFRSLSWRKPEKELTSKPSNQVSADSMEQETRKKYEGELSSCSTETTSLNAGQFDNLYDLKSPVVNSSEVPQVNTVLKNSESQNLDDLFRRSETPEPLSSSEMKPEANNSPIKSLSRKFSVFSLRSKKAPLKETYPSFKNSKLAFESFSLLMNQYYKDVNPPELVLGKAPSDSIPSDKKIYLILNEQTDKNITESERLNIEKFLYYPFSKPFAETLKHNDWKDKTELNKTLSRPKKDDNKTKNTKSNNLNVESMLTTRSINLTVSQKIDDFKNNETFNADHFSLFTDPQVCLSRAEYMFGVDQILETGMFDFTDKTITSWKIWKIVSDNTTNSKGKYKVIKIIPEDAEIEEIKNKYRFFLDKHLKNSDEKLYILRNGETPSFHGKKKVKSFGEYVFILPHIQSVKIWCDIMELLFSGKLNLNTLGLEVIGMCWKKYQHKDNFGYQLCFYVDDRVNFSEDRALLLLSDLRNMIPEGEKHYFKRCKTMFPGEREIRLLELP